MACVIILLMAVFASTESAALSDPRPNPRVVLVQGRARFTILAASTIRLEWAADSSFEDRPSLVAVNRSLPPPAFTKSASGDTLTITTADLVLTYHDDGHPFDSLNTRIDFATGSMRGSWMPGLRDTANLAGTTRTLDGADGDRITRDSSRVTLEPGLLSRSGWALIDDSARPLFDASPWPWVTPRPSGERRDLYFFAYGRDYKRVLRDFTTIAGPIPIPPRYAFGYWYSRWRTSSELELRELVRTFQSLEIPLDVLLIDMDWHITARPDFFAGDARKKDQAGQDQGWTGFTWNRNLFPDPPRFLEWMGRQGVQVGLNLHPASGIQPHEEKYPAMAHALGVDTATHAYVPFNIVDRRFAQAYFDTLLHPMENDGVDLWWLDWQQWNTTTIPGVNPTFYLNYLHFTDMQRRSVRRPMIYHRWGGLGNHRYQIGFSGDTRISWASLAYQPYFTVTAANVGFGYWGNDIGGFYGPPNTPELFTRWFQFGVFSPILKTHATGRDFAILRKLWEYPHDTFLHLRDLVHLRYSLLPYLYTAAYTAHVSGVSPCRPLYHEHPVPEEAYAFRNEYYFGPDMIVHPVTRPLGADSIFTLQSTWLPPGRWYEWHTGTVLEGDRIVSRPFRITDVPVYVRAGAIIPAAPRMTHTGAWHRDSLILMVFPGDSGDAVYYDDDGTTSGYEHGRATLTRIHSSATGRTLTITIGPVEGSYPGMASTRRYTLQLLRSFPPSCVRVNGAPIAFGQEEGSQGWHYDGPSLTVSIPLPTVSCRKTTVVTISIPDTDISLLNGAPYRISLLHDFTQFLSDRRNFRRQDLWSDARYPSDPIMRLAQTGICIGNDRHTTAAELRNLITAWPAVIRSIHQVAVDYPQFSPYDDLLHAIP
jgi:alpha-glucosidase (family GH31 glycosyl hydrolase)